jgi:ribA/ribD-fused uncharacterized protein
MIREFQGEYRWLSNFALVNIDFDGRTYPSVEHAYMSAKSDSFMWKELCANGRMTPGDIKKESRRITLGKDWPSKKIEVMRRCLEQKFAQEPFRTLLLGTGTLHIQEGNRWGDKFWGVDLKTGEGENNLGKLIMEIRETLKTDQTKQ